jgi:hypothetical protein
MFNLYKKIIGFFLPQSIKSIILNKWTLSEQKRKIRQEFRGHRVSYGKQNADVTFYVIRRRPPGGGLMSNYLFIMAHIKIALKQNMIPVIDMLNYDNFYKEELLVNGTFNAWEYYFEQPDQRYTLADVYASKRVVLSSFEFPHHEVGYSIHDCSDLKKIKNYNEVITNYVKVNDLTRSIIEHHKNIIGFGIKNILGISVRGTDYSRLRPAGHAIQPSVETLIQSVKEMSQGWSFEKIFLCTEEEEVVERFNDAFPGRILTIQRRRLRAVDRSEHSEFKPGEFIGATKFDRAFDKYTTGLEYLVEIFLLAECTFLLCGMTSGTAAAIYINGGRYADKKILDLGLY